MRVRVLPVILVLLLTGAFALINWTTFSTPTTLNLGVAMVSAPLGLVMLGIVALVAVMYIASVVYVQSVALLEARRLNRDLQAQRELADRAEASRLADLRTSLDTEVQRLHASQQELRAAMMTRLDQMEQRSRTVLEETANSLSAYIGQMEDRLERHVGLRGEDLPAVRPDQRGVPPR